MTVHKLACCMSTVLALMLASSSWANTPGQDAPPLGPPFVPASWQGPYGAGGVIPRAAVIQAIQQYMAATVPNRPDWCEPTVFVHDPFGPDTTLIPMTHVSEAARAWSFLMGSQPWYLAFVNGRARSEWEHPAQMLLINGQSGVIRPCDVRAPLLIDGTPFRPFNADTSQPAYLAYGEVFPDTAGPEVVYTPAQHSPRNSCAVIVVSHNEDGEGEKQARIKDVARVKRILNEAPQGPRIPDGDIKLVCGPGDDYSGASKSEALAAIRSLSGCKMIYFFYLGHGAEEGRVLLRDADDSRKHEQVRYQELFEALAATDPDELNIVIEACYSGSAILPPALNPILRLNTGRLDGPRWLKGLLAVSSRRGQTTSRHNKVGVPFIIDLERAAFDPSSDLNGDNETTLDEMLVKSRGYRNWGSCGAEEYGIYRLGDQPGRLDGRYVARSLKSLDAVRTGGGGTSALRLVAESFEGFPVQLSGSDRPAKAKAIRKALYLENAGVDTIVVRCNSTRLGDPDDEPVRITVSGHDAKGVEIRKTFEFRGPMLLAPGERLSLCELDAGYEYATVEIEGGRQFKFDPLKRSNRAHVAGVDLPLPLLPEYWFAYRPGQMLFNPLVVPLSELDSLPALDHAAVVVRGPQEWGLNFDGDSTGTIGPLSDSLGRGAVVRGQVPLDASEGTRIEVRALAAQPLGELVFSARALLYDTLMTTLDRGVWRHRYITVENGFAVVDTTALIEFGVLAFVSNGVASVGAAGTLAMEDVLAFADSAHAMQWYAAGRVQWEDCTFVGPAGGVRFDGARGRVRGGRVFASSGPGLLLSGALDSLRIDGVTLDSSAAEGVRCQAARGATLRAPSFIANAGPALRLNGGSRLNLLDDPNWSLPGHLVVEDSSECDLQWTTLVRCLDLEGRPIFGATVSVARAGASTEYVGSTDSLGLAGPIESTQLRVTTAGTTPLAAHEVHVEFADWDTTFSTVIDSTTFLVVPVPRLAGVLGSWDDPVVPRLRVAVAGPNPVRSLARLVAELPSAGEVALELLDLQGRRLCTLARGRFEPGRHAFKVRTERMRPAIYFVRLRLGSESAACRLVVL